MVCNVLFNPFASVQFSTERPIDLGAVRVMAFSFFNTPT
jgi:hypothetical protein